MTNDWRLQNQGKYLMNATFHFKQYIDRNTLTDHDHCEFCRDKFSDSIQGALKEGYATNKDYWWVCSQCYHDFKSQFNFDAKK